MIPLSNNLHEYMYRVLPPQIVNQRNHGWWVGPSALFRLSYGETLHSHSPQHLAWDDEHGMLDCFGRRSEQRQRPAPIPGPGRLGAKRLEDTLHLLLKPDRRVKSDLSRCASGSPNDPPRLILGPGSSSLLQPSAGACEPPSPFFLVGRRRGLLGLPRGRTSVLAEYLITAAL